MSDVTQGHGPGSDRPNEFLAFTLGEEEYGIPIRQVQELRGYESVTRLADAPAFMKGVINLRGIIVPIVDLRIRFGHADPAYDQFTVVIILQLEGRLTGLVVDSVADVIALESAQLKPAPELGARYLTGIGTIEERMLLLLDLAQLLSVDELVLLDCMAAA